jgi:hypothetical protein
MSKLFDFSSLAMIPSAYKDGKLYSVRPTDGSGDFTFSRGSNLAATRVDVNGLIEKGRENLITYSNDFLNASWSKGSTLSVTDGYSGYDGSNDAGLIVPNTTFAGHLISKNTETFTGLQTYSIYAKNGGYDLQLRATGIGSTNIWVSFDLTNGVVGTSGVGLIDSSITSVGGGWYRCSMTFTTALSPYIGVYQVPDGATAGQGEAFSGDGTSGLYIQDAQVELGLVATDYIETGASTAQAGILEDMPRLDYSGGASCPSLKLEPQRTNLVTSSEYTGGYSGFNSTQDFNAAISPEKVQNAVKIIATTHNTQHNRFTAFSASGSYSFSVFAKAGEYEFAQLYGGGNQGSRFSVVVNLSDGSIDTYDNITTSQIDVQDYGDGWYRIVVNGFNNTHTFIAIAPIKESGLSRDANYDIDYAGDGTSGVYFYGLQVEAGSYPTSYIPTYGSSVTRSQEGAQVTSVSDLIGQTQGTLFAEVDSFGVGEVANRIFGVSNGASAERVIMLTRSNGFRFIVTNSSVNNVDYTKYTTTDGVHKLAMTYDANEVRIFVDGVKVATDPSVTLPSSLNSAHIGKQEVNGNYGNNFGGSVKQSLIFPTALTDSECIALTTL